MQSYPPTSTRVELPLYADKPIYIHMCIREQLSWQGLSRALHLGEDSWAADPAHGPAQGSALRDGRCCKGDTGLDKSTFLQQRSDSGQAGGTSPADGDSSRVLCARPRGDPVARSAKQTPRLRWGGVLGKPHPSRAAGRKKDILL